MANNRMWIVNERTGATVFVGKYYPNSGWQVYTPSTFVERLNEAFAASELPSQWGDCSWVIQYESVEGVSNDPLAQSKISIVKAIDQAIHDAIENSSG